MTKKVNYNPLWKLLIDKNINHSELIERSRIGKSTFYKIKNNQNVTTDSLIKIYEALDCNISDIVTCENLNDKEKASEL